MEFIAQFSPFLFSLYSIEVFLNIELFAFFMLKWIQARAERHISLMGFSYLFLGIARIFLIFYDFYDFGSSVIDWHGWAYKIAAFFAFAAMIFFIISSESMIKFTRYIPTLIYIGLTSIILFLPENAVRMLYYVGSPLMIAMVISFTCLLMARTFGKVRMRFFVIFIGLCIYGIGYAIGADLIRNLVIPVGTNQNPYKIFQTLVVLSGLVMIGLGFIGLPSLSEIYWDDYTYHVYVFHIDTAVCIHDQSLISKKNLSKKSELSPDLFSSGVIGIIGLIKEMVSSDKRLKTVDHEDKKIILDYGNYVAAALVAGRDLSIYREKLDKYIADIETAFKDDFTKWSGEISKFSDKLEEFTYEGFKKTLDKQWHHVHPIKKLKQIVQFLKRKFKGTGKKSNPS
ncbi:MAG: hypothetical protein ACFFCS_26005 [Candidatus Hodarchaeota archaeon]